MGKIGSVKVGWDQPFLPPKNVREGGKSFFGPPLNALLHITTFS